MRRVGQATATHWLAGHLVHRGQAPLLRVVSGQRPRWGKRINLATWMGPFHLTVVAGTDYPERGGVIRFAIADS